MSGLGRRQIATLIEAAGEVSTACPWLPIEGETREVRSLEARGLVGATDNLFGIMPLGCLVLRRYDRALAKRALIGLRRERDSGGVMPWHVGAPNQAAAGGGA